MEAWTLVQSLGKTEKRRHSFKQVDEKTDLKKGCDSDNAWEKPKAGDTASKKSQSLGKTQPQPTQPKLRVIFVWESILKKILMKL